MLLTIKEQPVASLEELSVLSEASIAEQVLDMSILDILADGYPCNSIKNKVYSPDGITGKIMLPTNTFRARSSDPSYNLMELNGVLWDSDDQTDVFTSNQQLDLLFLVDYNDLPWELKNLVLWTAAIDFERKMRGSPVMTQHLQQKAREAQISADKYKSSVGRPSIFDSYRPWSVINRRGNPVGGNLKL